MDGKKPYLTTSGYNLHASNFSMNVPSEPTSGYRGSNDFICK